MSELERIIEIENTYQMQPHPEGGYYAPFYRSSSQINSEIHGEARPVMTSIHYLLTGSDFSAFHRLKSDEIWHFYEGNTSVLIHILTPDGSYSKIELGKSSSHGYQYTIPAHSWFAAELLDKSPSNYMLAGCTVSPGFGFNDFEMADRTLLAIQFPSESELITRLTKSQSKNAESSKSQQLSTTKSTSQNNAIINKIVIIMAMHEEALPVIETFKMDATELGLNPALNTNSYRCAWSHHEVILVINGKDPAFGVERIGTTPAALVAFEVINKISPDLIISAGTAGGYADRGAQIGDVYLSKGIVYHDRRIPLSSFYEAYGHGNYQTLDVSLIAEELNLKMGIISTGNSMTISDLDQEQLQRSGAVAKEMEVAAIAEVCALYKTPILAVKAITNIADRNAKPGELFWKNLNMARDSLSAKLPLVLKAILGKKIESLAKTKKNHSPNTPSIMSRLEKGS